MGIRKPNDIRIAEWQGIELKSGKNDIEVLAKHGNKTVTDFCVWEYVVGLKEIYPAPGDENGKRVGDTKEVLN
ncbi:hypothetical protein D3C72_2510310 [compost metagenome]